MQPLKKWLCFRLETGVTIIASTYLVLWIISLILFSYIVVVKADFGQYSIGNLSLITLLIISALIFCSGIFPGSLLYGVIKKSTWALWPTLILGPIDWSSIIFNAIKNRQPLYLLGLVLSVYNWLAVWSLRQEILKKRVTDADNKV